jgi:hypothetical protein
MSDRNTAARPSLGDALRALPSAAPDRDAWPALAAQLKPQSQVPARRRRALPLAFAAACLLAVIAAYSLRQPQVHIAPTTWVATVAPHAASSITDGANMADAANATNEQNSAGDAGVRLAALESRSQALERWLRDTRLAASPLPGQDLAAASEIENLIGLVDVELAAPGHTDALALWQRRVALLEDLTALRYSNYRLAETALADVPNRIN